MTAGLEFFTYDHDQSKEYTPSSALLLEPYIPTSYKDAVNCPDSDKWIPAIEDEYQSIMERKTWRVVPLPIGRKPIKCKWILDFKPGHKGVNPRFKARLVACGYGQLYGIDYLTTYSPVVKHYSIRIILGIVAALNLELIQLDMEKAFLYGKLNENETIYMNQPEGYVVPGRESEVCLLDRPIYGLKQASNCWNVEFNKFLLDFGFTRCKSDPCVYIRIMPDGEYTILLIYVDDGMAASNRPNILIDILNHLRKHFQVRSLPPNRFVGLDITRDRTNRTLSISQPEFIKKMLKRYNMEGCNPVSTPADTYNKVTSMMTAQSDEERRKMERTPVREAIGSLMYLMAMTRGDIAYAVNQVSAFVSDPGPALWEAVKRIFAYLAGTTNHGITFGGEGINAITPLIGYTDADYASDIKNRKSITGIVFLLYGGAVSWGSKRQRATALSTTDAEFFAASEGSRDAVWIKALLTELKIDVETIPIYCDSKCARSIIEDPENHHRVKHIDVKYFFVREQQEIGTIKMTQISTDEQIADIFTKPLSRRKFEKLRVKMGIQLIQE